MVRRASTAVIPVGDATKPTVNNEVYIQANGVTAQVQTGISAVLAAGRKASGDAATIFKQDGTTAAPVRKYMVHVYYISADNGAGQNVPTLTRLELSGGAIVQVPLVEGIEEMNVEYGIDTDGDGQPDAYTADPTNFTFAGCTNCTPGNNWTNVVTANLHVLARSVDPSPGHADTRTYRLGLNAGGVPIVFGPKNDRFRRNAYSAMVRIANPAGRRDAP